jgi:hypothetical protein
MMLRGEKPLAVFHDVEDAFPAAVLRYLRMFDRHVRAGTLVKQEQREHVEVPGLRHEFLTVFYAPPAEVWRIEAMIELRARLGPDWSEEDERRQGTLLGYTDAQNDVWIASRFNRR